MARFSHQHITMILEEDKAPPEVIEAEANATPNRKLRIAAAAVGALVSFASGGSSGGILVGQVDASGPYSALVLFDNPVISLLIDAVIGGTCVWAIQQEQKTKEENIRRIWKEVRRRRAGGSASASNRSQRRAKKVEVAAPIPGTPVGFGGPRGGKNSKRKLSKAQRAPPQASAPAQSLQTSKMVDDSCGDGGLLEKAKDFFDEANTMGKAQALVLNAQLEEAGVLPSIGADQPSNTSESTLANEEKARAPREVKSARRKGKRKGKNKKVK